MTCCATVNAKAETIQSLSLHILIRSSELNMFASICNRYSYYQQGEDVVPASHVCNEEGLTVEVYRFVFAAQLPEFPRQHGCRAVWGILGVTIQNHRSALKSTLLKITYSEPWAWMNGFTFFSLLFHLCVVKMNSKLNSVFEVPEIFKESFTMTNPCELPWSSGELNPVSWVLVQHSMHYTTPAPFVS